jgi:hypothetical protein
MGVGLGVAHRLSIAMPINVVAGCSGGLAHTTYLGLVGEF